MAPYLAIVGQRVSRVVRRGRQTLIKAGHQAALPVLQRLAASWTKPKHAAFILDGSRRYAVKQDLRTCRMGHERGAERFYQLISLCHRYGIPNLSVYAFSIENFKRSPEEIDALLDILRRTMEEMRQPENIVNRLGVRVCIIGDRNYVPPAVREAIERVEEHTRGHQGMRLFMSVAYDGREELVQAARRCAGGATDGHAITMEEISRNTYLRTHVPEVPRVDFIVRTGGCKRLSSFLMWDATHAEIYFTEKLWPEFDEYEFLRALMSFASQVQSSQVANIQYWSDGKLAGATQAA
jgi:undecaprenyl diphosphate synthase